MRGPAADSRLGVLLLDVLPLACAVGHALDLHHARWLCGTTLREGVRRADGSLDRAGFLGGTADMIRSAARLQGLDAMRAEGREEGWRPTRWRREARARALGGRREARPCQRHRHLGAARCERQGRRRHHCSIARGGWSGRGGLRDDQSIRDSDHSGEHMRRAYAGARAPCARCLRVALCTSRATTRGCHFTLQREVATRASSTSCAQVDARDFGCMAPLMWATKNGHEGAAQALLAHGARQELQDKGGYLRAALCGLQRQHQCCRASLRRTGRRRRALRCTAWSAARFRESS